MTDVVVFSLESWDGVWRRNQYLVDGLLRSHPDLRVLFVEPARDPIHDLRRGHAPVRGAGRRVAPGYGGRLILFQPTKWMPRAVGPFADAALWHSVRRALRRSGFDHGVLWVNDPAWAQAVTRLRWPSLYDITDDWLVANRGRREHNRLLAQEEVLLSRCGVIVVCSTGLLESRRDRRPDAVLVPNAVDVARYREPSRRPPDLPDARCAVYVGTLHEDRLDVDLVRSTGSRLAQIQCSLVLVGPDALNASNSAALASATGIEVLGARPHGEITGYLQHADILVVPHVVTSFTDSLDPIKLYEYLAVGRPVVSTPVAGFRELGSARCIEIADRAEFADAVVRNLFEAPMCAPHPDVPDWSERVAAFSSLVDRLASTKAQTSASG